MRFSKEWKTFIVFFFFKILETLLKTVMTPPTIESLKVSARDPNARCCEEPHCYHRGYSPKNFTKKFAQK
jgi:hypothetical protein